MAVSRGCETPELFPRPKFCELTGGISELGIDVRLATNNVLPIQRKAVRSVLTASGVRVVANKKKYVVNAQVETPEAFDLSGVPEDCRNDYYELTVKGSEVHIRSPYQEGMVWASQTLASIFRLILQEKQVPNLFIKDWPVCPVRGIFVDNKWGPDRMNNADWFQAIDAVSSAKMNTLGIGLYGCWGNCRFAGADRPAEFLMIPSPLPEQEFVKSEQRLRWYDPLGDMWHDETYMPLMAQQDFLPEVITYGRERGVNVIPFFNCLGHNTLLPKLFPEISAKTAAGKPTSAGFCLSSERTKAFLSEFFGAVLEKYYPTGLEFFHLQLNEIGDEYPLAANPQKKESDWCSCPACKDRDKQELFTEYLIWLADFLLSKGVQKIVLWSEHLVKGTKPLLNADFVKRLEVAGLKDKIILHWWCNSNDKLSDQAHAKLGTDLGIASWVAPATCCHNWSTYENHRPNIEKMLKVAEAERARGAVAYGVFDPSHLDHDALLGAYTWESADAAGDMDAVQKRWAFFHFGSGSECCTKGTTALAKAASGSAFKRCLQYPLCFSDVKTKEFPLPYPETALTALETAENSAESLQKSQTLAEEAVAQFRKLLDCGKLNAQEKNGIMSLLADAVRVKAIAKVFLQLLKLREELKDKPPKKAQIAFCDEISNEFKASMKVFAENKPLWLGSAALQPLSVLLLFLKQLASDIQGCCNRKKNAAIHWNLPDNWEIPADF